MIPPIKQYDIRRRIRAKTKWRIGGEVFPSQSYPRLPRLRYQEPDLLHLSAHQINPCPRKKCIIIIPHFPIQSLIILYTVLWYCLMKCINILKFVSLSAFQNAFERQNWTKSNNIFVISWPTNSTTVYLLWNGQANFQFV